MRHLDWRWFSTTVLTASLVFGATLPSAMAGSEWLYAAARQQDASRTNVDISLTANRENGNVVSGYFLPGPPVSQSWPEG